ncbi:MAG: hypothetical protein ACTXOO_04560 [Sodalis sp. (in: enterobacteria)]
MQTLSRSQLSDYYQQAVIKQQGIALLSRIFSRRARVMSRRLC